jgi:hypothetical protein
MARTIVIGGNLPEPDVVVFFEQKYTVRRVTRSVQKALEKSDIKVKAAVENDDSDMLVAAMADGMDALLDPDGHEVPAKKAITEAWKGDKLSAEDLQTMYQQLQESAVQRPT